MLSAFQKSCIHVCYQHMERSITGIRQKEKENQNTSTGDLGVYSTGVMVVRSRVKGTKANRGSDLGSQGCAMALLLQKGAQPEAGLTLLLDEEVQTSVGCAEQISGVLPFRRGCCGCLHLPSEPGFRRVLHSG